MAERPLTMTNGDAQHPLEELSLNSIGTMTMRQGDLPGARAYLEECLSVSRELSDRRSTAVALVNLGELECELGNLEQSRSYFAECLEKGRELGWRGNPFLLEGLAGVAAAEQMYEISVTLYGAASHRRETSEIPISESERQRLAPKIAALRAAFIDEALFEKAWQKGHVMDPYEAAKLFLGEQAAR